MPSKPPHQPSLFTAAEQRACIKAPQPVDANFTAEALREWKTRVGQFQARVQPVTSQGFLFEAQTQLIPEAIAPFSLPQQNFFFFNWPADRHPDSACLYFVIDSAASLLLYVGETCRANQRWKGVHDCKQYVLSYQALHFHYRLKTAINTAFYWEAPKETRPRQQLESALIRQWRSPFNKENWRFWGTPFV